MTTARVRTPTTTLEASTPAASAECRSGRRTRARPGFYLALATQGRRATTHIASSTLPPRDGVVARADADSASARTLPNRHVTLPANPRARPRFRPKRRHAPSPRRTCASSACSRGSAASLSTDVTGDGNVPWGKRWRLPRHGTRRREGVQRSRPDTRSPAQRRERRGRGRGRGSVVIDGAADAGTIAGTAARASLAVAQPSGRRVARGAGRRERLAGGVGGNLVARVVRDALARRAVRVPLGMVLSSSRYGSRR